MNSWNKKVFEQQLSLNLKELGEAYPPHWSTFLKFILSQNLKKAKLLDVGCGAGVYYKLCSDNFPLLKYKGIDFSQDAISMAKAQWDSDVFEVKNYKDLKPEDGKEYDILLISALLDNLEDADEAFRFILSLDFPFVIASRLRITDEASHRTEYDAYRGRYTAFHHNYNNLQRDIEAANYNIEDSNMSPTSMCVLLKKK